MSKTPLSIVSLFLKLSGSQATSGLMALYLRSLCFAFTFQSLIALFVSGTSQAFLSVQAPVVYVVAGKTLTLDCKINGTSLSASLVSWKHEGKWLHNHTQQLGTKVQLVLRQVKRQEDGIYQCSVFNFSGLSSDDVIPKDANVTILVGGPVSKPVCISNGLTPPKISLIWNAIDDYQSVFPFTYNVLYCHKPSVSNPFCFRPPHYNLYRDCTGLSVNPNSSAGSMVVECNVTSLFKRLYPNLFDIQAEGDIIPRIFFSVNIGNVQSDAYSSPSLCNTLDLVKCTKPENIRLNNLKKKTLSLVWDAPTDMSSYSKLLRYRILHAADGTTHSNQSTDFVNRDYNQLVDLSYDITGLHPYTMYHIYIACSINSAFEENTRGEFIGLSARTVEEEPSHYPTISENFTSTLHGKYRNVTLHWKLPDNKTWNGIITRIELHYWKANSNMSRNDTSSVVVLSNVSMTTGTLTNLRLDESYAVVAQMCTRVGCGPPSQSILITRRDLLGGTSKPRTKEQGYFYVIVGVTLGLLLCITCAVLLVYLWSKKLRRRKKKDKEKPPLAKVIGELPHLYETPNDPSKIEESGDYDETIEPLLGGDKEYVLIKAPQPESLIANRSQDDEADFQHSSEV